jgi:hypothetical protein
MPIILPLRRMIQEYFEFEVSLGYKARPCHKKRKKKKSKLNPATYEKNFQMIELDFSQNSKNAFFDI